MFRRSCYLLALILGALLASSACGDESSTVDSITIIPPGGDANHVGIVVGDQVLNGWLYGSENDTLVILSHMRPNDQTAWEPFAMELAEHGYAALTFDFRGYGISPGPQDFDKLDEDLAGVVSNVQAVLGRADGQIFLIGASMGGTTAIVVAADEAVAGVVAISAPAEFQGQNAVDAIAKISAPVYLIAAEEDTAAMVSLDELLEASGQTADSETFAGDEHGTALLEGPQAASVRAAIFEFLDKNAD